MADEQKVEPCERCGGTAGLEMLQISTGPRWRVRCVNLECGSMTPNFSAMHLALAVWNERTAGRSDRLAE